MMSRIGSVAGNPAEPRAQRLGLADADADARVWARPCFVLLRQPKGSHVWWTHVSSGAVGVVNTAVALVSACQWRASAGTDDEDDIYCSLARCFCSNLTALYFFEIKSLDHAPPYLREVSGVLRESAKGCAAAGVEESRYLAWNRSNGARKGRRPRGRRKKARRVCRKSHSKIKAVSSKQRVTSPSDPLAST
jgi:hypothetical protein